MQVGVCRSPLPHYPTHLDWHLPASCFFPPFALSGLQPISRSHSPHMGRLPALNFLAAPHPLLDTDSALPSQSPLGGLSEPWPRSAALLVFPPDTSDPSLLTLTQLLLYIYLDDHLVSFFFK